MRTHEGPRVHTEVVCPLTLSGAQAQQAARCVGDRCAAWTWWEAKSKEEDTQVYTCAMMHAPRPLLCGAEG